MAINLAAKYESKLAQVYNRESILTGKTNTEYKWSGVNSITVLTAVTQPLNDYYSKANRAAAPAQAAAYTSNVWRYGVPTDVQDTKQDMPLTVDKSFSMVIDRADFEDQVMAKKTGAIIKAEIGEVVTPFFDMYALQKWGSLAGQTSAQSGTAVDKDTVLDLFIDAHGKFFNYNYNKDLYAYVSTTTYSKLLRNPEFISVEKLGAKVLTNGVVGKCMDIIVVEVPDNYMVDTANSTTYQAIFTHKRSVLAPTKIKELKIHTDAPGISGSLIEGRYYGDAFVLGVLNKGVIKCTL